MLGGSAGPTTVSHILQGVGRQTSIQLALYPIMSTSKLHVLSHPLVNERFSRLRQASTSPKEFREVRRYQASSCLTEC
jgi:hypothetical protein